MRNCLKCSSYRGTDNWCTYHGINVRPTDTCDYADIDASAKKTDENCHFCGNFRSTGVCGTEGYCSYHRTSTQASNGCNHWMPANTISSSHTESTNTSNNYNNSYGSIEENNPVAIILGIIMLFGVAMAIYKVIVDNLHISMPIISVVSSIILAFLYWLLHDSSKDKIKHLTYLMPVFIIILGIVLAFLFYQKFKPI